MKGKGREEDSRVVRILFEDEGAHTTQLGTCQALPAVLLVTERVPDIVQGGKAAERENGHGPHKKKKTRLVGEYSRG